ncbi:MAG: hypothetical protein V3V92_05485 [Candidatus Hydrothermarchaeales archaeon]
MRMLLVVVVLTFTIATGYRALDAYQAIEEEAAGARAVSEISLKAKMAGMGGEGAREIAIFELTGGSKLLLRNEDFNGTINGIIDMQLSMGGRQLKVLSSPLWDSPASPTSRVDLLGVEKVFLSGSHRITITHLRSSVNSSMNGKDFLLIG